MYLGSSYKRIHVTALAILAFSQIQSEELPSRFLRLNCHAKLAGTSYLNSYDTFYICHNSNCPKTHFHRILDF
jgi:hypothetical protein